MIFYLNESKSLSEPKGSFIVEGEKDFGTIEVRLPAKIDGNDADGLNYEIHLVNADIANIVLSELPTTQGVLYGNTSN